MLKYILASASERRKELLARLMDNYDVIVSNFDEDKVEFKGDIEKYVISLSRGKALDVASKVHHSAIIIAADTIVSIDNKILGKPKDKEDAYNMLKLLSGNVHKVYSAITVINTDTNDIQSECTYTEVYFSKLTDDDIWKYINTGECNDKAGSYGIQGLGGVFVEKINGCYYNVVGLPLNLLNRMLKKIT